VRTLAALNLGVPVVSIGPETTKAAEAGGVRVLEEASTHDLGGLVDAVIKATR
jgi:uroporphyrinogen-III synthase